MEHALLIVLAALFAILIAISTAAHSILLSRQLFAMRSEILAELKKLNEAVAKANRPPYER